MGEDNTEDDAVLLDRIRKIHAASRGTSVPRASMRSWWRTGVVWAANVAMSIILLANDPARRQNGIVRFPGAIWDPRARLADQCDI